MTQPETYRFADDGCFPNSALPLLVYRNAMTHDAAAIEQVFADNEWSNAWQNGIFLYDHFHSTAHEVLGIAHGTVRILFGGPSGQVMTVRAGDVVVVPAGVAHRNVGQSEHLLVVGAYPDGRDFDVLHGDPAEHDAAVQSIGAVPPPRCDPVAGSTGPLCRLWGRSFQARSDTAQPHG